jgi:hypothetical protein
MDEHLADGAPHRLIAALMVNGAALYQVGSGAYRFRSEK